MPTGNLPGEGKELWERVYDKALKGSCKGDEECAAKTAWEAVKSAGWYKDSEGNWRKKAQLQELSLTIKRVSQDPDTKEMRWKADASSTAEDSYGDNMTVNLFKSFINRIEEDVEAPEPFRSDYWNGGMPYVSISHFPDLNGDAVPGEVKSIYMDGRYLKSKGVFYDTLLGEACWSAIKSDFSDDVPSDEKVRISIGFLDWEHVHKSNGQRFRRYGEDDVCSECVTEFFALLFDDEYVPEGKIFLDGQLVHLALTRVPANKETMISPEMEVRSMTTQEEDAKSIVGEELAEEIKGKLEEALEDDTLEDKALVIKTEEDEEIEEPTEEVVEKTELEVPIETIRSVVESVLEEKNMPDEEIVEVEEQEVPSVEAHILEESFGIFRAAYDEVSALDVPEDEKLRALQEPFNVFANYAVDTIRGEQTEAETVSEADPQTAARMDSIEQKVDLLLAQMDKRDKPVGTPERRSADPSLIVQIPQEKTEKPSTFKTAARRGIFNE